MWHAILPLIRLKDKKPESIAVEPFSDKKKIIGWAYASNEFVVQINIPAIFDIADLFAIDGDDPLAGDSSETMPGDIKHPIAILESVDIADEVVVDEDIVAIARDDKHYFAASFLAKAFARKTLA